MDQMRKTVVRYTACLPQKWWKCRSKQGNTNVFPHLLSSSGLHHVPVDSVECMQCILWSGLLVPAEGHTEGSSARRGLWWGSVRQSSLFPSSMPRSVLCTWCQIGCIFHNCPVSDLMVIWISFPPVSSRSWWSLVRVDRVVGVWCSVWRWCQAEEQNLLCSSSQERWAGLWGHDPAEPELQQPALRQRRRHTDRWLVNGVVVWSLQLFSSSLRMVVQNSCLDHLNYCIAAWLSL